MVSDLVAYGLLMSIFVVTTLRMFVEKPSRLEHRPRRLFERLRRGGKRISQSIDS
jgi:hypothetical protein